MINEEAGTQVVMGSAEIECAQTPARNAPELEAALLRSVARQLMTRRRVTVGGFSLPVRRTSRQYLRIVNFSANGHEYAAIEQNAAKSSYWAELARKGHQVVQFKDVTTGRFVAVVVDGAVRYYREKQKPLELKAA